MLIKKNALNVVYALKCVQHQQLNLLMEVQDGIKNVINAYVALIIAHKLQYNMVRKLKKEEDIILVSIYNVIKQNFKYYYNCRNTSIFYNIKRA